MRIKPATRDAVELFMRGVQAFSRIEHEGILIDREYLNKQLTSTQNQIRQLEKELKEDDIFKTWRKRFGPKTQLGSKSQLERVIFDDLKYERTGRKTNSGGHKADESAFEFVDHPFVKKYFRCEKLKKARSTYLLGYQREICDDDRIHPIMDLHTTVTYRPSCNRPNVFNIPVRNEEMGEIIRSCVIAPKDFQILEVDLSGAEVCWSVNYHKDPKMKSYIEDPTSDMHRDIAAQVYMLPKEDKKYWGDKKTGKLSRYCNPAEAPIWMGDFSFKSIGEVKVGDEVIGWTRKSRTIKRGQNNKGNRNARKKLVRAKVTHIQTHKSKVVKVVLASGKTIRCTPDHFWLNGKKQAIEERIPVRDKSGWGKSKWRKTGVLVDNFILPEVGKFLSKVVEIPGEIPEELKYKAGWFAGMMDGEGTYPRISQCPDHNPYTYAQLVKVAKKLGFPVLGHIGSKWKGIYLQGGIDSATKFLNWCKPVKTRRIKKSILGRSSFVRPDEIISVEPDGEETVYALTTTTGNYVAWGYASKNCAKNKFVFPEFYGSFFLDCAQSLWEAIDLMKLEAPNGIPLKKHLRKKGIKKLGVPKGLTGQSISGRIETEPGTFLEHIRQVENDFWNNRFKVYKQWKWDWWKKYCERGWFRFLTGFVGQGLMDRKQVCNSPVQGAAFHHVLWSLCEIQDWMIKKRMKSKIFNTIYDSICFYAHKKEVQDISHKAHEVITKDALEHWKCIIVPITIEAELSSEGESWYKKKKVEIAT